MQALFFCRLPFFLFRFLQKVYFCVSKSRTMKRNILALLTVVLTAAAFAQTPRHLRVLHYVPDSCFSLYVVNLDTVARVFELESLHREQVLKPIYDSLKFSKKFVQSWIKRDNKTGIDFTASMAVADSRYFILPLNNERNFEKTLRSLDKSLPPFETTTTADGQKIRCMVMEDEAFGMAVLCNEDVACVALLADMTDLYSVVLMETAGETAASPRQETPMQVWSRLIASRFDESEIAKTMLSQGWNSYTAYNPQNSLLKVLGAALNSFTGAPAEIRNMINRMDMEIFSRTEVRRDRLTFVNEYLQRNAEPNFSALRFAPEKLERIFPYMSGDNLLVAYSAVEGLGDLIKPYVNSVPQLRDLWPLLNQPMVFTMNGLKDEEMLVGTLVDQPEAVHGILKRYVAACNRETDSLFKVQLQQKKEQEEAFSQRMSESEEYEDFEMNVESLFVSAVDPDDSTINRKTLSFMKIDGWDAHIIVTKKKTMDYETYTLVTKDDSACVLVKDGLLFYTNSLSALGTLSNPLERELPKEYLSHPVFLRADFDVLAPAFGSEITFPVRDLVCFMEGDTFTATVNAAPGLHHGLLFETVKFIANKLSVLF